MAEDPIGVFGGYPPSHVEGVGVPVGVFDGERGLTYPTEAVQGADGARSGKAVVDLVE